MSDVARVIEVAGSRRGWVARQALQGIVKWLKRIGVEYEAICKLVSEAFDETPIE